MAIMFLLLSFTNWKQVRKCSAGARAIPVRLGSRSVNAEQGDLWFRGPVPVQYTNIQ